MLLVMVTVCNGDGGWFCMVVVIRDVIDGDDDGVVPLMVVVVMVRCGCCVRVMIVCDGMMVAVMM